MLSKKSVLVTGASKGIGQAIANDLLAEGAQVLGTSRHPDQIDIDHENFKALSLDLRKICQTPDYLKQFVAQCDSVNAVVLNAGYGRFGGLEEFSQAQIIEQLQQNLIAQILLAQGVYKKFKQAGGGDIIFIGSESALQAGKQGSIYSAGKFGLRGFSQAIRQEGATSDIRVTLINPGMVKSAFFDDLNFAPGEQESHSILPEQVADAVSMVLSAKRNVVFDEINLSPLKKVIIKRSKQ